MEILGIILVVVTLLGLISTVFGIYAISKIPEGLYYKSDEKSSNESVRWMSIRWFKNHFCKHKNKTELLRCYQDRFVTDVCNDCGKFIYSDL